MLYTRPTHIEEKRKYVAVLIVKMEDKSKSAQSALGRQGVVFVQKRYGKE